jgi:hypothetical protein
MAKIKIHRILYLSDTPHLLHCQFFVAVFMTNFRYLEIPERQNPNHLTGSVS